MMDGSVNLFSATGQDEKRDRHPQNAVLKKQDIMQLSLIGVPTNSVGKKNGIAGVSAALHRAWVLDALDRVYVVSDEGDIVYFFYSNDRSRY